MNRRLSRFLAGLYPQWFRSRYEDEYTALLEDVRGTHGSVWDALKGAAYTRLADLPTRTSRQSNAELASQATANGVWLTSGYALFLFGSTLVYGMLDDSATAGAMHAGSPLRLIWVIFLLAIMGAAGAGAFGLLSVEFATRVRRENSVCRAARHAEARGSARSLRTAVALASALLAAVGAAVIAGRIGIRVPPAAGHLLFGAGQLLLFGTIVSFVNVIRVRLRAPSTVRALSAPVGRLFRNFLRVTSTFAATATAIAAAAGTAMAVVTASSFFLGPISVGPVIGGSLATVFMLAGAGTALVNARLVSGTTKLLNRRSTR